MVKVIGTVVDSNLMLIGFKMEGSAADFGMKGTNRVVSRVSLQSCLQAKVKSQGIDFSNGRINIVGSKKLNEYPMEIYMGGDNFSNFDNSITVIQKIMSTSGSDPVGYVVRNATGNTVSIKAENIENIVALMKPTNFIVRKLDNGKTVLAAPAGGKSLAELPCVYAAAAQMAQHSHKSTVKAAYKEEIKKAETLKSFEEIIGFVQSCSGLFAMLPGSGYTPANKGYKCVTAGAQSFKASMVANPSLKYTMSNANINLAFKQLGSLEVDMPDGSKKNIFTVAYRDISIYTNGKLRLNKIAVVLDKKYDEMAKGILPGAFEITDETLLKFIAGLAGKTPKAFSIIGIDLTKLPAFDVRRNTACDWKSLGVTILGYDAIRKLRTQVQKAYTTALDKKDIGTLRQNGLINKVFDGLTDDEVKAIKAAGVDLRWNSVQFSKFADNEDETEHEAASDKPLTVKWSVAAAEGVAESISDDYEEEVEKLTTAINNADIMVMDGIKKRVDDTLEGLQKLAWGMNRQAFINGDFKVIKYVDKDGIGVVETTTKRMTTSKAVRAEVNANGINAIDIKIEHCEEFTVA